LRRAVREEAGPGRVGALVDRSAAGRWLRENLGVAPAVAVVLGSGLSLAGLGDTESEVAYDAVPHWRVGQVRGHAYVLTVKNVDGKRWAVLGGRIHEYEGFSLDEVQLPVRSLAAWGVRRLVLTSASGAVGDGLSAGDVVLVEKVLDLQYRDAEGRPVLLDATSIAGVAALNSRPRDLQRRIVTGIHASVPGPQYETAAELELLRRGGVATVSMTPAGELRAALDEGMTVAVVIVVANAGETTHSDVLAAAECAADDFVSVLRALVLAML
jgi:purine-nucleoside phosphorylase